MHVAHDSGRTWRFPRRPLEDQVGLALWVWAGAIVFAMIVVTVVSFFRTIEISAWEIASGVAPWFVAIMSGWMMFVQVPLFVASGRTRHDSFIEWAIFAAIYPFWTALLTTVGYLLERLVYGLAGWPPRISEDHLFTSHTDVGRIFLEYLLTFMVWTSVGAFVGASIYRSRDWGWFSLILAALLIAISGTMERGEIGLFGVISRRIPEFDIMSWAVAIPMAILASAVAVICTWFVVRDVPLRNR